MVERGSAEVSLVEQACLLSVSRSSLYYTPRPPSDREVWIKHRIDALYTEHPYYGARRMAQTLQQEGVFADRKTMRAYMQEMGLEAVYPKPDLSRPHPEHQVFPYLLRGLKVAYPNHVWGVDITYIRLQRGWMYLVAILDWYSRYVVSWELDQTLEIGFVLACLDRALERAVPAICNSDQGSHFTSPRFVKRLLNRQAQVSMDGRGRAMDNIFTERLWRSVKYEEVYLKDYETPRQARAGLTGYLSFYNNKRPHQSLGYRTPAEVYFANPQEPERWEPERREPQEPDEKGVESNLRSADSVS